MELLKKMNFEAYGIKNLRQNLALLDHASTSGVTSVNDLQSLINDYLDNKKVPEQKTAQDIKKCDCGREMRYCNITKIWECTCGFSEMLP